MRILIVDDDEDLREVTVLALAGEGHEAVTAVDGVDALRQLAEGPLPDVILLDMMLPRMDGEAFMGALRASTALATLPVVIISGHHAARQKAVQLGAVACLVKPIELDQLLAIIDAVGGRRRPADAHPPA